MTDDSTLLRRYVAERAEEAFAEFVRRNLPLVYSAAVRRLGGDTHRAEDVAQVVFSAVARDARRLSRHAVLTGWLYTATRYAVVDAIRAESRRRAREEEAHMMQETLSDAGASADWSRLRPVLDSAMDELSEEDREAVLLRFFQGRPFAEIGTVLGLSEDTARKRVERALDKLRGLLPRHGIASTSAAIAALLASETVMAAPASLAASITGAAVATGGAAAGVGAFLAVTKLQAAIAATVLVGATVGLVVQQREITAWRDSNSGLQAKIARQDRDIARLTQAKASSEDAGPRTESAMPKAAATEVNRTTTGPGAGPGKSGVSPEAATLPPVADTDANRKRKASYHREYDPFFAQRGFTPAQVERMVELFILQADAREDLQASVRQARLDGNTPGIEKLRSELYAPILSELQEIMGDAYEDYYRYQDAYFYRAGWVDRMQPVFTARATALTPEQTELMVMLVAKNNRKVRKNPTDIGSEVLVQWDDVASKAGAFLSPAQQAALQVFIAAEKAHGR